MSVNNFENKVQQKMENLLLKPTAQVWEDVERRINEKKKRRIIFWFLFPGLLLLSGGGWWLMNQTGNKNGNADIVNTATDKIKNIENNKLNDINFNTTEDKNTTEPENLKPGISAKSEKKFTEAKPLKQPDLITVNKKKSDKILVEEIQSVRAEIKKQISAIKNANTVTGKTKLYEPVTKDEASVLAKNDLPDKKDEKRNNIVSDTTLAYTPVEKKAEEIEKTNPNNSIIGSVKKTENIKTPDEKNGKLKKRKWEIGLTGSIGSSKLNTKGLFGSGLKSNDLLFSSSAPGTGSLNSSFADSISLKGTAWQLGFSAKRNTGKKISYSLGLNLSYYSTKQYVGTFVDSVRAINNDLRTLTSGGFYRSGVFNSYRNKYYYLQVPVLLLWQINNGNKLPPLILENGLSPSFMIGSNALAYDESANLFYKDKRVFNKFSLVYHTALGAKLFTGKKQPMTVGLFYNYQLSRLQKVNPPDYNYLSSFGIKINWLLTPVLKLQSAEKK